MGILLKEISDYWTNRVEGYSEVNHKELMGIQQKSWTEVLEEHFPIKAKEDIKILDIGTGPGFFPMILSKQGYYVTAVDYTQGMIDKAKENLKNEEGCRLENVNFFRMDAQNLEFEENQFDVILSRNLTWNLENPKKAYEEWCRVLKPGGIIMNFDANWYGYLYDDEKRDAYEQDRKNVEKNSLDDHYLCTDIDRMENIARKVPLSNQNRPEWDKQVLERLGMRVQEINTEVWKSIWSDEEKLNYASTPMFLIVARK